MRRRPHSQSTPRPPPLTKPQPHCHAKTNGSFVTPWVKVAVRAEVDVWECAAVDDWRLISEPRAHHAGLLAVVVTEAEEVPGLVRHQGAELAIGVPGLVDDVDRRVRLAPKTHGHLPSRQVEANVEVRTSTEPNESKPRAPPRRREEALALAGGHLPRVNTAIDGGDFALVELGVDGIARDASAHLERLGKRCDCRQRCGRCRGNTHLTMRTPRQGRDGDQGDSSVFHFTGCVGGNVRRSAYCPVDMSCSC